MALPNGKEVKGLVEALGADSPLCFCLSCLSGAVHVVTCSTAGFKHLEIEVTSPRIAVFREAILEAFTAEHLESKQVHLSVVGASQLSQ